MWEKEREKKHKRDDGDGAEDMSGDGGGGGGSNSFLEALFCAKCGAESLASITSLRHQKAYEKGWLIAIFWSGTVSLRM